MQDKDIIAWDKALYYFTIENRNYDNIWFCEDDVYIHSIDIISKLDCLKLWIPDFSCCLHNPQAGIHESILCR